MSELTQIDGRYVGELSDGLFGHFRAALPATFDNDFVLAVAEQLAAAGAFERATPPAPEHHAVLPDYTHPTRWLAVHDSELKDLKAIGDVVKAIVAGSVTLGAGLGAVVGLCVLLYQYRRNSVPLDQSQAAVLLALKVEPAVGLTVADVAERAFLPVPDVERALTELRDIPRRNNKLTALVRERGGRWFAMDV